MDFSPVACEMDILDFEDAISDSEAETVSLADVPPIPPSVAGPIVVRTIRSGRATERIDALWEKLPSWATGTLGHGDESFLDAMITKLRPERVYEFGVAAGSSSAFILNSMAAYADPTRVWLHSYDIAGRCYFDESYAVGEATRRMVPELQKNWNLTTGKTAFDLPPSPEPGSLYFIDADHAHPAPTLDLIALLSRLSPGDHVIFHDINLPRISHGKFLESGASWLFEDWLGERYCSEDEIPNIGAIVLPHDRNLIRASLAKTLARPWDSQLLGRRAQLNVCQQRLQDFFGGVVAA